jgi:hypothetical protein
MVERREVVGGGLVAGLAALVSPAPAAAAMQDEGSRVASAINDAGNGIESELRGLRDAGWGVVNQIRELQRSWIRATQKYPDFIEVGLNAWDGLVDWHVRYQQPLNVARGSDGRYVMVFMFTTILLRPEQALDYMGLPFDAQRR